MQCIDCGKQVKRPTNHIGTGMATRPTNNILGKPAGQICYACCARDDQAVMTKTGHSKNLPLYLSKVNGLWVVQNWPGTLRYVVAEIRNGRHNIARTRRDVWFLDADGNTWHGVHYGEFTQIVHCKRIKGGWPNC